MWEQLALEDADKNRQCRPACISDSAPGNLKETHSDQDEHFDNYRQFVAVAVQATQRCIMRATGYGGAPLHIKHLPKAFEMHWGTAFDMDRLGLQGTHDLADLLSLFPDNFVVDRTTPDIPTVVCQFAGYLTQPIDDVITKMLWLRSHHLQPKKLVGCIDLYRKNKEAAWATATDVYRQHCCLAIWSPIDTKRRETSPKDKQRTARGREGEARAGSPSVWCRRQKVNLVEELAHHPGCGCPACVVERAAEAYCFMRPGPKYSETPHRHQRPLSASKPQVPHPGDSTKHRQKAEVKKRHLTRPRGSVEVSMRKLPKTTASQDLFRCAEAFFDQTVAMSHNLNLPTNPRSTDVYYNPQASAPIPGAPALPTGYPPPPNPGQFLSECRDSPGGAGHETSACTEHLKTDKLPK